MKILKTIAFISMAILVLVSSTSFMVGMHYCGKELQNVALFSKADGCESEAQLPPCHKLAMEGCCNDETIIHEGQGLKASVTQIHLSPLIPIDIEQPLVIISEIIPTSFFSRVPYLNYDSPFRACDLTISLQVFLI